MSSKRSSENSILDLELPTSQRDIEALRRARDSAGHTTLADALQRLSQVAHLPLSTTRRATSEGWADFSLEG